MQYSLPFVFFFILVNCLLLTNGEVKEISSPAELINVFNNAVGNVVTADLKLVADLDFSSSGLNLPLGAHTDGSCIVFSGSVNGNGHSIRHLVMDNKDKAGYNHGGLFCMLSDATIENLVIESTCSFAGIATGAVCVNATGSVTMKNVINKAAVTGTQKVGGFIGNIFEVKNKDVQLTFTECVNKGTISSSGFTGGFVGEINQNKKVIMKTIDCSNEGDTAGNGKYVGGFVGYIFFNTEITITSSNSINKGHLKGDNCGGFFGGITYNKVTVKIIDGINDGTITAKQQYAGGFIALFMRNNDQSGIIISNGTNYGEFIRSETDAAGFVGHMWFSSGSYHNTLFIENSANRGRIQSDTGVACGMACIDFVHHEGIDTTVVNSINDGTVDGKTYAFGIVNIIKTADNVVGMGEVISLTGSYTFWDTIKEPKTVEDYYGLEIPCKQCSNAVKFKWNDATGVYESVQDKKAIHRLLNEKVLKEKGTIGWSKYLQLIKCNEEKCESLSGAIVHVISPFVLGIALLFALLH